MHCGESQFHLGLHTRSARYATARSIAGQVVKQGRLADTRFARHHQRLALTRTNCRHEPIERVALGGTVNQLHRAAPHRNVRRRLRRKWRQPYPLSIRASN